MAKRKPKPQQQKFNPITYLKSGNARRLPLLECLIPENWEKIKKFHLSELMSFYSPWIYYYSKTGQLRAAYFLVNFLTEHGVLIKNTFHPIINEAYMSAATERANLFYEDVRSGLITRDGFLDIMLD